MALRKSKNPKDNAEVAKFTPPSDPNKLVAWGNNRLEDAHRIDEFTAKQNLSFMLGNQWVMWDDKQRRFSSERVQRGDPNAPVRVTVNKIGGHVERVIAKLTKDQSEPRVRPVTDTASDVNGAKVATRVLRHELDRLKFHEHRQNLYFWTMPLGWSFTHVRWDPEAGPPVGDLEDGETLHRGEIVIEEVPAFEIRLDPNAKRFDDARWLIRTVAMTKEAAYDQYGIVPDTDEGEAIANEWRMTASPYAMTPGDKTRSRTGYTGGNYIAVHQFWMKPGGRARPNGCVFTWSGKTVLEPIRDFPYEHGKLPFVPLNLLPAVGGDPAGRTWVTDLVPLQKDYNDSRSREAMIRRTLTPKIVAPKGAVDPHRMTSRVEVLEYNPIGSAPQIQMPDGRWMAQFQTNMDRVDQEMGDRSGQQDVSQGRAASSAAAATVIALQEADETKLAISSREQAAYVRGVGYQILCLVKQFWDEERTVRTWSRDGTLEVTQFRGSDVVDQLDVHVSSESSLPRSMSARIQMASNLWAEGVIQDPVDYVRMLDLPEADFTLDTISLDAKQAEREHGYMLRGEQVEVKVWENHEAHLAKHDEFRKSEEYEQAPPEAQAIFDAHCQVHYEIATQKAFAAAQGLIPMADGTYAQPAPPPVSGPQTTNPTGANGQPTDPMTGNPADPNAMAGGLAPTGQTVQPEAGLPPGIDPDVAQAHLGN